jgi:multidrug efflux pump subunit AcrB
MMVVHLYSPDKSRDPLFISNYATVEITDMLNRIYGVGAITVFGARDYSMRVWLDPDRLYALGLTTGDVVTALQGQNVQVASGVLNQPPVAQPRAFQIAVRTLGRLADPKDFADIVVKQSSTAVVRLKDVGRIELAAVDYSTNSYRDLDPAVALAIYQLPGSNALAPAAKIKSTMDELSTKFPAGLEYTIIYIRPSLSNSPSMPSPRPSSRQSSWSSWWSSCSCRPGAPPLFLSWQYLCR